jgi:hypothetical protein
MINYTIKDHRPGRIKVHIPIIKRLSLKELYSLADMDIPSGIKDITPNPLTGNVIITYDPSLIDIEGFISSLASDERILRLVRDKF